MPKSPQLRMNSFPPGCPSKKAWVLLDVAQEQEICSENTTTKAPSPVFSQICGAVFLCPQWCRDQDAPACGSWGRLGREDLFPRPSLPPAPYIYTLTLGLTPTGKETNQGSLTVFSQGLSVLDEFSPSHLHPGKLRKQPPAVSAQHMENHTGRKSVQYSFPRAQQSPANNEGRKTQTSSDSQAVCENLNADTSAALSLSRLEDEERSVPFG